MRIDASQKDRWIRILSRARHRAHPVPNGQRMATFSPQLWQLHHHYSQTGADTSLSINRISRMLVLVTGSKATLLAPGVLQPSLEGEMKQNDSGWQIARLLVEKHGEDAPLRAAMQAQRRLTADDFKGGAAWIGIARAVDQLLGNADSGTLRELRQ